MIHSIRSLRGLVVIAETEWANQVPSILVDYIRTQGTVLCRFLQMLLLSEHEERGSKDCKLMAHRPTKDMPETQSSSKALGFNKAENRVSPRY